MKKAAWKIVPSVDLKELEIEATKILGERLNNHPTIADLVSLCISNTHSIQQAYR